MLHEKPIETESEYKAALMADGDKILTVLDYMCRVKRDAVFTMTGKESEKLKEVYKVQNLQELIQEIKDANLPTAPKFN